MGIARHGCLVFTLLAVSYGFKSVLGQVFVYGKHATHETWLFAHNVRVACVYTYVYIQ